MPKQKNTSATAAAHQCGNSCGMGRPQLFAAEVRSAFSRNAISIPTHQQEMIMRKTGIELSRRHLFAMAGACAGAGLLAQAPLLADSANESVKQIDAGVLRIGYVEDGPSDGPAVILLHGWPYDVHSYGEVTPLLVAAGYRVLIPYLRGYGPTRFLSGETPRDGQQSGLGVALVA